MTSRSRSVWFGILIMPAAGTCGGADQEPVPVIFNSAPNGGPGPMSMGQVKLGDGFTMQRVGALGFCPSTEGVHEASVSRDADGDYNLSASRLIEGDAMSDPCLENTIPEETCFVEVPLPDRALTDEHVEELRALLSAIPEEGCRPEQPSATDPCLVSAYEFADRRLSGWCDAGGNAIEYMQSLGAVASVLTDLALQN